MKKTYLLFAFALTALSAWAGPAEEFHARFAGEVSLDARAPSVQDLNLLHYPAPTAFGAMLKAKSLDEAIAAGRATNLDAIAADVPAAAKEPKLPRLRGKKLTLVILPGVFAEFIKTHAFEEVFSRPSAFRDEFRAKVEAEVARGNADASDPVDFVRFHGAAEANESASTSLNELINVGDLKLEGAEVRVVLLGTPFGSMESLGQSESRTEIFIRRLEKYLRLTGEQDLAFVGYSRGTILGLDMLAEARRSNRAWLKDVKGLVSLGGVIWGSSLADDALQNEQAPIHKILGGIDELMSSLEFLPDDAGLLLSQPAVWRNNGRWKKFFELAGKEIAKLNEGKSLVEGLAPLVTVDPRNPAFIVVSIAKELGLDHFSSEYNQNIRRARYALGELLGSIRELGTDSRLAWWKSHALPANVTYYAIAAVMADPEVSGDEKKMFENPWAYGDGSYDDKMLLGNHRDYLKISGLSVNDSQVAVPQAVFLPELMGALNPANRGLRTRFLGVVGTHHWGLALREVNTMLGGQQNGFPREALLRAIAGQVLSERR